MDFDNMTKEELLNILKMDYTKLIKAMPFLPEMEVGKYYNYEQTGDDEIWVDGIYLTSNEFKKYFEYKEVN